MWTDLFTSTISNPYRHWVGWVIMNNCTSWKHINVSVYNCSISHTVFEVVVLLIDRGLQITETCHYTINTLTLVINVNIYSQAISILALYFLCSKCLLLMSSSTFSQFHINWTNQTVCMAVYLVFDKFGNSLAI